MVQAWYRGGVSVRDFTDSANPKGIAYFERGPLADNALRGGGSAGLLRLIVRPLLVRRLLVRPSVGREEP